MKKIKYIVFMVCIFLLDQISKFIIMKSLELNETIKVIGNFFRITYVHNYGAAFGILDGKTIIIVLVSLVILLYLIYELFFHKKSNLMVRLSSAMIIAGLLGNLVDRLYFGYVRDFFDFNIFGYNFAIFNIGDVAIVVGAFLYLLGAFLEDRSENKDK